MLDWQALDAFLGVDLDRSEVVRWHDSESAFVVELRGILTPLHPAFEMPRGGNQDCCKPSRVVFPFPREVAGLRPMREALSQPSEAGATPFGFIQDLLQDVDGSYRMSGPFGEVMIRSMPVRFEVTSQKPCL